MSHPYDASTKFLVQTRLADWLGLCGLTTNAPVELIDADLSTVTAVADRVLCIRERPAWLLHLELQSSRDPGFIPNLPVYNTLLERQHGLQVRTVVVALRSSADTPELTGVVERAFGNEPPYLVFRYQVVRLWQLEVERLLNGLPACGSASTRKRHRRKPARFGRHGRFDGVTLSARPHS